MAELDEVELVLKERDDHIRFIFAKMESEVAKGRAENTELQNTFNLLKDDFLYNLKLISERDEDLDRCETAIEQLKSELSDR